MNDQPKKMRQKLLGLFESYWWVILILVVILAFATDISLFNWIFWSIGIIIALFIFAPVLIQFFAPVFVLIFLLVEHFNESKKQSAGKRYFFIPATLVATASFIAAQTILSVWVLILSVLIWASVIGFILTFIAMFFFGLAPLVIFTAPFVVWYQSGFVEFLAILVFFLMALFWFSFSKMAFSEDYYESTPEDFLGYSPHTFLLGALSFQVIALPFYYFGFMGAGNLISDAGGAVFLLFALIATFKWYSIKKKLTEEERENLYRPSVWIYVLGLFLTNFLYADFTYRFEAPTAVLFWLNGFFLIAILGKFFGLFRRRKKKPSQIEGATVTKKRLSDV